jgi:hypothetical protein
MTDPGYYDQSIPPALLVGRAGRASAPAPRRASAPAGGSALQLSARPGGYSPSVPAAGRPKNLQELQRVTADPQEPWAAGTSVPIGVRGKRAHWTGEAWKLGLSPGYALEPAPDQLEADAALQEPAAALEGATQEQPAAVLEDPPVADAPWNAAPSFPGDEAPGDLSR